MYKLVTVIKEEQHVRKSTSGFTLVEMLLVLAIMSATIFMITGYLQQRALQMRIDRTTAQMQQVLNSSLAFYVANGRWPNAIADLQPAYLPVAGVLTSPFGQPYQIAIRANTGTTPPAPSTFFVYTTIGSFPSAASVAQVVGGTLPLAYISGGTGTGTSPPDAGTDCAANQPCSVVASVNIPGQNLNNARALNYAGVYHHGGCVPEPECPVDSRGNTMTPELFLVPVAVIGANDNTPEGTKPNAYAISSFTAHQSQDQPVADPAACNLGKMRPACTQEAGVAPPASGRYWRACLQVGTIRGQVSDSNTATGVDAWGRLVTLLAMTRCKVTGEPAGSPWSIYSN